MADKVDFKKDSAWYKPGVQPELVTLPPLLFIAVDGEGAPDGASYQEAVQVLYALTFTIKMSKLGGELPAGYFEYVVPPLEGLWWSPDSSFDEERRDSWLWTSMIRQPDFVTPEVFAWAVEQCRRKKPDVPVQRARLERFEEGLCVQRLHIGPYAREAASIDSLYAFIEQNGLVNCTGKERKHHEIYLSDPRKTDPARLRTILRLPVEVKK